MPKQYTLVLIQDMVEATENAIEFTEGLTWETFCFNKMVIAAVLRQLEILGEVTKLIPEETKIQFPDLPWKRMGRAS